MMAENIHQSINKSKQSTKEIMLFFFFPYLDILTYRVAVGILGLGCLPIVGIPLLRPWLNVDELRGIDDCTLVDGGVGAGVISTDDDDGRFCSFGVRLCGVYCERTGVIGLLLTSLSKPFSLDVNCLAVNVEFKSCVGFLTVFWIGDGVDWVFGGVFVYDVCEPRYGWSGRATGGRGRLELGVATFVRFVDVGGGGGGCCFNSVASGKS